jgi:hypothetical protein
MNFFKRLFKSEIKTLTSITFKLSPLNQAIKDKKDRNMLINYLTEKHGEVEAWEIINSSKFGLAELIPGDPLISIHTKDDKCFGAFQIVNDKLEERKTIDHKSKKIFI